MVDADTGFTGTAKTIAIDLMDDNPKVAIHMYGISNNNYPAGLSQAALAKLNASLLVSALYESQVTYIPMNIPQQNPMNVNMDVISIIFFIFIE